jgi:hypothetical protein
MVLVLLPRRKSRARPRKAASRIVKQLVLGLVVGLVWIILTAAVAWAVPQRGGDTQPDLSLDEKWLLRTPYNPMHYDKVTRGTSATTTTTTAQPRHLTEPHKLTPRPPPSTTGVEQWRYLVAQYPWPVETMLAIMRCESGGDPLARNRSGASGLFQLLPGPPGWQDPATNVRLAYTLKYVPSGLAPWNASRSCWG